MEALFLISPSKTSEGYGCTFILREIFVPFLSIEVYLVKLLKALDALSGVVMKSLCLLCQQRSTQNRQNLLPKEQIYLFFEEDSV